MLYKVGDSFLMTISSNCTKLAIKITKEIVRKKPSDAKADFVVSIALSSTMGPGVRVNVKDMSATV